MREALPQPNGDSMNGAELIARRMNNLCIQCGQFAPATADSLLCYECSQKGPTPPDPEQTAKEERRAGVRNLDRLLGQERPSVTCRLSPDELRELDRTLEPSSGDGGFQRLLLRLRRHVVRPGSYLRLTADD